MNIRDLLDALAVVDQSRAARAMTIRLDTPTRSVLQGGKVILWESDYDNQSGNVYDVKMRYNAPDSKLLLGCTCADWTKSGGAHVQEGLRNTRPCKHLLALASKISSIPVTSTNKLTVEPLVAPKSAPVKNAAKPAKASFASRVSTQIAIAIRDLADKIEALLNDGQVPLVIGPTGCGKTSAHRMIAVRKGFQLVESAGAASYSDADMVGIVHVNGDPFPGPLADAFSAAREMGENVLLFLDEFTRFNARAQEALMRPLLPIGADAAQAMGIDTDVPVRVTSAPFWGTEWGPAEKIQMSLACNPWGTAIDPALIRRTTPVFAEFPEGLANLFSDKIAQAIKASWSAVSEGRWPLPIEYQALAKAQSPDDASIFLAYSNRLRAIDPAAADGFAATLQSLGL